MVKNSSVGKPDESGQTALFPPVTPYSSGFLRVDDIHELYWEQSGNPDGVPIILLHGGPGAGATPTHRRFFDPAHYRIVIFDQRGAGRSHPHGELRNNTTAHLVADMETLRTHLSIDRWHVFGGSWGSTLAMRYAIAHPERCIGLILRGIFLCEPAEIDWFLYGMKTIFPEAWEEFSGLLPPEERGDILNAYYRRLTSANEAEQMEASVRWSLYESACSMLIPSHETIVTHEQRQNARALARIEAHYFLFDAALPEHSILNDVDRLRPIPATIVQGRYDLICPILTANKLHKLWPEADYIVVPDAGHSAMDPALRSRLVGVTESFKRLR